MTYVASISPTALANGLATEPGFDWRFDNLQAELASEDGTFWCFLKPQHRPSFTAALLADLHRVQALIGRLAAPKGPNKPGPVGWAVLASRTSGIFNLGGDLPLFTDRIRAQDRDGLRRYAYSCVDVVHRNATGYGHGVVTIGLAQGDALGGGFESLLSCDVIVAERRARFGLPEIMFNLFPGMGAHCFLTRRLGAAAAERIIMSAKVYTAEEMHEAGVVDVLAEDGGGETAVRDYVKRNGVRRNAHSAIYQARRRVNPITIGELRDVTDIWVDAALRLTEQDLRRMSQLAALQDRSLRRTVAAMNAAT